MTLTEHRGERYEYKEEETGRDLYSCTQIRHVMAPDWYLRIPTEVLELARKRGRVLHARFSLCLMALAKLCEYPLPILGYEGYCRSMDDWLKTKRIEPIPLHIEQRGANVKLGYAGKRDAQIHYGPREVLTTMDLKTGQPTPTDKAQLLAYDELEGFRSKKLLDLYIQADGSEAKEVWVKPQDRAFHWAGFLNALNLLKWRASL